MTVFKITSDSAEINITSQDLFSQILNQAFSELETNEKIQNVEDYVSIIDSLISNLNENKLNITFNQIYSLYFLSGYFYKVFMSKNNVQLKQKDK